MKVSEVIVQRYCDFDTPEKKMKATEVCGLCHSDICQAHKNLVPIKKYDFPIRSKGEQHGPTWVLLEYAFVPVCPDCSSETFSSLVESLSKTQSYKQGR